MAEEQMSTIMIVSDENLSDMVATFDALGYPGWTFTRGCFQASDGSGRAPTINDPATHWLCHFWQTADQVAAWVGYYDAFPDGIQWGTNGVIALETARAAWSRDKFWIYAAAGDVTPLQHVNGIFSGRGMFFVVEPD